MALTNSDGVSHKTEVVYSPSNDSETVRVAIDPPSKAKGKHGGLHGKKSTKIPLLFERASGKWWNPQFDSKILEDQLWKSYFPQTRNRFQCALYIIMAACAAWCIFFIPMKQDFWVIFLGGSVGLLILTALTALFTRSRYYKQFYLQSSLAYAIILCTLVLVAQFAFRPPDITSVGTFTASVEILLMLYTVIPIPLFVAVLTGVTYSLVYELLTAIFVQPEALIIVGKLLLHLCIHLIGILIFITLQVQKRSTFWKTGQSVMAQRDLQVEKQLKEQMIHSLMPPSVAEQVISSRDTKGEPDEGKAKNYKSKPRGSGEGKVKGAIIFRPFNMNSMDNVSILFADIVGFTKMSSNKTAAHLVGLLNDLFGRFDSLCADSGCEKISTLGDCYYCVSGCPEPKEDHAKCCVEMGLGMIKAIREFDEENNEQVNMRVGVHTGTVLCGIVGTRRFKFDVWSNDVTMANTMESTGSPGRVHISEASHAFLKDDYIMEEGEEQEDNRTFKVLIEHYDTATSKFAVRHTEEERKIKTYFIVGRKDVRPGSESPLPNRQGDASILIEDAAPSSEHMEEKAALMRKEQSRHSQETKDVDEKGDNNGTVTHPVESPEANGVSPAALLGRRHSSGFYATSELSLDQLVDSTDEVSDGVHEKWKKIRQLREQSDIQLIKCIQEDITNDEFFYNPPINFCTLNFNDPETEEHFCRKHKEELKVTRTVASPRLQGLMEKIISLVIFLLISVCCFMMFGRRLPWILTFVIALLIQLCVMVQWFSKCRGLEGVMSNWWVGNLIGGILCSLPAIAVYSNFSCDLIMGGIGIERFYFYCLVVSLLHFCNFTMISSWFKSTLAAVTGIVIVVVLSLKVCPETYEMATNSTSSNITLSDLPMLGGHHRLRFEIILDIVLLLLLIWFLNRESEFSHRLSYHVDYQAAKDKEQMQENRDQADWLLHNIIPPHVAEHVKKMPKYSKNHKDVGVIFATIVNFNEFYDESYEGGREYLRVLNELVSDYEDLLDKPQFKDVEKIKTIMSSFMAASGLNETSRAENNHEHAHLVALMDFSNEMLNVVRRFNESIFNFEFVLNVGFNYGDVTAGVIGTTKLLYDIWGDTVNIASRMYSTGVPNRIQVPESTANLLGEIFEFEYRGDIFVKGKGDMRTYLMVKKRDGCHWD